MSFVQPPGRAPGLSLRMPLGANTPGAGQVLSVVAMTSSILNGRFLNALWNGVAPVLSTHVDGCGGDVRLTSFCNKQVYAVWSSWRTCVVRSAIGVGETPDPILADV